MESFFRLPPDEKTQKGPSLRDNIFIPAQGFPHRNDFMKYWKECGKSFNVHAIIYNGVNNKNNNFPLIRFIIG